MPVDGASRNRAQLPQQWRVGLPSCRMAPRVVAVQPEEGGPGQSCHNCGQPNGAVALYYCDVGLVPKPLSSIRDENLRQFDRNDLIKVTPALANHFSFGGTRLHEGPQAIQRAIFPNRSGFHCVRRRHPWRPLVLLQHPPITHVTEGTSERLTNCIRQKGLHPGSYVHPVPFFAWPGFPATAVLYSSIEQYSTWRICLRLALFPPHG